jgi:thiol-disulfide isomerase/thioredoxin
VKLLDFQAAWCQPCKIQEPIIRKWAASHPEVKVEVVGVDNPEGAARASAFFVQSLPTLVFTDDKGGVLAAQPGMHNAARLDELHGQALRRSNK